MLLGITVEGDAPFGDVASSATHAVAIARLESLGITQGYADGTCDTVGRSPRSSPPVADAGPGPPPPVATTRPGAVACQLAA